MTFLLLNQAFHPDTVATGQYLTELALALVAEGHQVTVITSRRAYDDRSKTFPAEEIWRGIRIRRIASTAFGKTAKWRRAIDFASFLVSCIFRLVFTRRHDAVLALTSPPLISALGACFARMHRSRFFYWVMDFNPDEAIAAGWLGSNSIAARFLEAISRFSLRQAHRVIALDTFMRDRIAAKDITPDKILVFPPWSHDDDVRFDEEGRDRFRKTHGLDSKFVVMYSGNHSPCHPLDTLLAAADRLKADPEIVFCFVGGGSEWRKVQCRADSPSLASSTEPSDQIRTGLRSPSRSIVFLPYQPLPILSASLSAADLHVVVMGDRFVGLVHPCKLYNILAVGAPVLYIGPSPSHVTEILGQLPRSYPTANTRHADTENVVKAILDFRSATRSSVVHQRSPPFESFRKDQMLPRFLKALTSSAE